MPPTSTFTKIHPVRAELIHAGRWVDMTKLTVCFLLLYTTVPKNLILEYMHLLKLFYYQCVTVYIQYTFNSLYWKRWNQIQE